MKKFLYLILFCLLYACGTNNTVSNNTNSNTSFGTNNTFEALTWNLEQFPKHSNTINRVKGILEELKIDVLAFQEINDINAFYELANSLPDYEVIHYSTRLYDIPFLYNPEQVTLLDSYKIFTNDWNAFPRPPHIAKFLYKQEVIYVINNHLKAMGDAASQERRRQAVIKLDDYISQNLPNQNVIILGDLNDEIDESGSDDIFTPFKTSLYKITDYAMTYDDDDNSYPSYPSHLDHIIITNELFDEYDNKNSITTTLKPDKALGWGKYDTEISDHRPVAIRLEF